MALEEAKPEVDQRTAPSHLHEHDASSQEDSGQAIPRYTFLCSQYHDPG
jgi:hypothetical protein